MKTTVDYKGTTIDLSEALSQVSERAELASRYLALEGKLGTAGLLDWLGTQPAGARQALYRCLLEEARTGDTTPGMRELCGGRLSPAPGDLAQAVGLLRQAAQAFMPPPTLGESLARVRHFKFGHNRSRQNGK